MDKDKIEEIKESVYNKKCSICKNFLSVSPVVVIISEESEDEFKLRCGRCKDVECGTIIRCTFYEEILELLTFPCIYKKCDKLVAWGQVEEHEKFCPFRTIHCPVYYQKCGELIELTELEHHVTEKHPQNIQYESASFNMRNQGCIATILLVDNKKFFVYAFNHSPFCALVLSLLPCEKFTKFNIKLNSETDENFFVSYHNQKIIEYDDKKHCFKCLSKKCNSKEHPNSQIDCSADELINSMCTKVTMDSFDESKSIKFTIDLIPNEHFKQESHKNKSQTNLAIIQETNLRETKVDSNYELLRQTLECPICNMCMLAPIYSCSAGHTICKMCKSTLQICPYCKKDINDTRCFALEHMAETLELSCVYKNHGCVFVGKVKKVCEHEVICSFKPQS